MELKTRNLFDLILSASKQKNYLLTDISTPTNSYYEAPAHPAQAYFSFIDTQTEEQFAAYLKEFWTQLGTPELVEAAPLISELAFALSTGYEKQGEDVSQFVYTMY